MRGNVSVQEALKKGRFTLVYLPMLILLGSIGVTIYLVHSALVFGWTMPVLIIMGFISSWLVWSINVNKWKVWAFENVRNVHELKRKAIEEKLIWPDGSWFEKTEFKNNEQKQKLKYLEKKFLDEDVYFDDFNIPNETKIFYSKTSILFGFTIGSVLIGFTFYSFYIDETSFYLLFITGLGLYFLYFSVSKIIKKGPQLILNPKGIKLYKKELCEWHLIHKDIVIQRKRGKHVYYYLEFEYKNDEIEVELNDLGVKNDELEHLLRVYRLRYEKNKTNL